MSQVAEEPKLTRPVLRYHGGKWLLAPWIISHFPKHRIYAEPYGGAGSVLLRKQRSFCEIYNDLDGEIVHLFRILRDRESALRLCDLLELTPFSRADFDIAYEDASDAVERARRCVVRSFFGFAATGICDIRSKTGFRAASKRTGRPHAMDWVNFPECLWLTVERLKGVTIECREALEVIRQQDDPETLFYIDPPYLKSQRNSHGKQYRFELGLPDHHDLAKVLKSIRGKCVISGYPSELYDRQLYADWRRVEKTAAASGQVGQVQRTEVLWLNF